VAAPAAATLAPAETGVGGAATVIAPAASGMAPAGIATNWETMAPLPSARVFNAVVADGNGFVYVFGGTSDAGALTPTSTTYRYNVATDTWDTMAAMPVALDSIDGALVGSKIYIPGGATTDTTYVYDIAGDSWSSISTNGGYTARSQYQVVVMGTSVYVLGGIVTSASASTTEVWILDTIAGTWAAGTPMQKSRTSFSAAAVNGEIIVAGGVLFPGFTPDMTTERFNGTTWSYGANIPNGGGTYTRWSYNADGQTTNGLWLAGGRRDAGWAVLDHAAIYEPGTDSWTDSPTIPTLAQARVYMEGAVASDGYFYVIGGRDSAGAVVYATNERLMVADAVWTVSPVVVGGNGSVTPSTPQSVPDGDTIAFTLTPDPGYEIDTVTGCSGALVGNVYTTGPITADCTVSASFRLTPVAAPARMVPTLNSWILGLLGLLMAGFALLLWPRRTG